MSILIFVDDSIKMLSKNDIFNYHCISHENHHKSIQNLVPLYLSYQVS